MDKTGLLMKTFGWSRDYCLDELDGAEGWVWFNFSRMSEARIWGTGLEFAGDKGGYVQQEKKRLENLK